MKLILAPSITLFFICSVFGQNTDCVKLLPEEGTRQGYSATISYKEDKAYRNIQGKSLLAGTQEPLENVFVEVFIKEAKGGVKQLRRVAGCRTSSNGKFSFPEFAKGKYLLRLSKDGGFAITEISVKVSPKSKRDLEIEGIVQLGT